MQALLTSLLIAVMLAPGCFVGSSGEDESDQAGWVTVSAVELINAEGLTASFRITGSMPDPCHHLADPEERVNTADRRFEVDLKSARDGSQVCATVIQDFEEVMTFEVTETGEWTFIFTSDLDEPAITETVTLPI